MTPATDISHRKFKPMHSTWMVSLATSSADKMVETDLRATRTGTPSCLCIGSTVIDLCRVWILSADSVHRTGSCRSPTERVCLYYGCVRVTNKALIWVVGQYFMKRPQLQRRFFWTPNTGESSTLTYR